LKSRLPSRKPRPSAGVIVGTVIFAPLVETPHHEWFLRGTETARIALAPPGTVTSRIAYPCPRKILALDPDILSANQRIFSQ